MSCNFCEDTHYYTLTLATADRHDLEKIRNAVADLRPIYLYKHVPVKRNEIEIEDIIERCDHGDARECESGCEEVEL